MFFVELNILLGKGRLWKALIDIVEDVIIHTSNFMVVNVKSVELFANLCAAQLQIIL